MLAEKPPEKRERSSGPVPIQSFPRGTRRRRGLCTGPAFFLSSLNRLAGGVAAQGGESESSHWCRREGALDRAAILGGFLVWSERGFVPSGSEDHRPGARDPVSGWSRAASLGVAAAGAG